MRPLSKFSLMTQVCKFYTEHGKLLTGSSYKKKKVLYGKAWESPLL